MKQLYYRVCSRHPETHLIDVECIIPEPNLKGQIFSLPTWIPGSYLIRDFSRYVVDLKAHISGKPVLLDMLNKNTWQSADLEKLRQNQDPLILSYKVYAYDLTPRGAHVDTTHAFFNGSRIFMQVSGYEDKIHEVELLKPEESKYHSWRLATSLPRKETGAPNYQFGLYQAKNYDDLIDHPIEMGDFEVISFMARDLLHELVITHTVSKDIQRLDISRLKKDLQKIAEHHIDFFGEAAAKNRFVFLLTIFKGGQGGIEHKQACVVHASYEEMPKLNSPTQTLSSTPLTMVSSNASFLSLYRNLLSLLSHEYFHAWHVKRIKPKAFVPYDLNKENYTRLLWLFEGITSYYDELSLVRTGLISISSYLEALTQLLQNIYSAPGRYKHSLEESSFEAWIKLYKPDENSRNTTISYYGKGALVGLCLDLLLRRESKGKFNLDDVMVALWVQYGREEKGLPEQGFELLVQQITGLDLSYFFNTALRSTEELPIEELLTTVGIGVTWQSPKPLENLGGRISSNSDKVELIEVLSGSCFEKAGFAARDQIIAVNGHKVDRNSIETVLSDYSEGEELEIHIFRRDELKVFSTVIETSKFKTPVLHLLPTCTAQQKTARRAWLKQS